MSESLKKILKVVISLIVIFLICNLFVFFLPIILLIALIYYLYRFFVLQHTFKKKTKENKETTSKKHLNNKIMEADVIAERFDE